MISGTLSITKNRGVLINKLLKLTIIMKATTLKNRIEKLHKRNCIALQIVKELTGLYSDKNGKPLRTYRIRQGVIRPCDTSGTGRYTTLLDYTQDVCNLLDELKVKYICGNDAPRGGLCGNWIRVLTKIEN